MEGSHGKGHSAPNPPETAKGAKLAKAAKPAKPAKSSKSVRLNTKPSGGPPESDTASKPGSKLAPRLGPEGFVLDDQNPNYHPGELILMLAPTLLGSIPKPYPSTMLIRRFR